MKETNGEKRQLWACSLRYYIGNPVSHLAKKKSCQNYVGKYGRNECYQARPYKPSNSQRLQEGSNPHVLAIGDEFQTHTSCAGGSSTVLPLHQPKTQYQVGATFNFSYNFHPFSTVGYLCCTCIDAFCMKLSQNLCLKHLLNLFETLSLNT